MADPFATPKSAASAAMPVDCPNCAQAMRIVVLQGHYGREVVVDLCAPCRLVWFDTLESVNLSHRGWLQLLRALQQAAATEAPWAGRALGCPHCRAPLQPVHNLSRFGRFASIECQAASHGHLQSYALLLAERGLVRPMLPPERAALATGARLLSCLNCGAPLGSQDDSCSHCTSPLVMIDLPRLAAALLARPGDALPRPDGRLAAWHCAGCGQALDPTRAESCARCGQLVTVPTLVELGPMLDACEAQGWAQQQPPAARATRPKRAPDPEPWRATSFGRLMGHLISFLRK
jgi:hypothetical protein